MRESVQLLVINIGVRRSGRMRSSDRAASLVEYALLVSLIAVVCFVAIMFFGNQTDDTFSRVGDSIGAM